MHHHHFPGIRSALIVMWHGSSQMYPSEKATIERLTKKVKRPDAVGLNLLGIGLQC